MLSSLKIPYHASLWKLRCLQPRIKLELKFWKQRESKPFFRLLGEPPFHCFCASRGHGGEAERILLLLRQMTRVSMASCVSPLRCLFDHEKCLRHLRLTLVGGGGMRGCFLSDSLVWSMKPRIFCLPAFLSILLPTSTSHWYFLPLSTDSCLEDDC